MRGQFSETLAFIFLVIFVTFFIVFIRISTVPTMAGTVQATVDAHETKYLRAGTNVVFFSTEPVSGKPMMELLGLAAYMGNREIDMGRYMGTIDVGDEITERMDAIFGKGKWYMEADFPELSPEFQIVVVADTSGSMCNDIINLRDKLPEMLQELKNQGRKAQVTVYLLPSPDTCCEDGQKITLSCMGLGFPDTEDFNCQAINNQGSIQCASISTLQVSEDWGNGIACASEFGPRGGWREGSIRIGIPLSDELSMGSECCADGKSCASGQKSVETAITQCKLNNVKVFPLRADPCGMLCNDDFCPCKTMINMSKNRACSCGQTVLVDWMGKLAKETSGNVYDLTSAGDTAQKISDIVTSIEIERISYIELGTPLDVPKSQSKRIRSWDFVFPVSYSGKYTTAHVYSWQ